MTGVQWGAQILVSQILLAAAWPVFRYFRARAGRGLSSRQALRLSQAALGLIVLFPLAGLVLPESDFSRPAAQVWAAPSFRGLDLASSARFLPLVSVSSEPQGPLTSPGPWMSLFGAVFAMMLGISIVRVARGSGALRRLVRGSFLLRRSGQVEIRVHDGTATPLAFWRPGRAFVLLPSSMAASDTGRIAIRHELQHHRQRDTHWAHLEWILLLFFGWNPALRAALRVISDLQEFACDEALLRMHPGRISPRAYARCLIEAAQLGLKSRSLLAGTTSMASAASGPILKRRIDMMFESKKSGASRWAVWTLGTAIAFSVGGAAYASRGVVRDRRVSLEEARHMLQALPPSKFPITLNDAVLGQLNRYIGTPDGRAYMRESLARMQTYRRGISAKIVEYGLPEELMAIPITESGYRNFKHRHAAGLWMFIEETARNFDLRVDDQVDERLEVDLETDAAMRLLGADYLRFKDWGLALLAYNTGETKVQRGIDATGARDVWKLLDAGFGGDKDYIAAVMAAALILRNPACLD